MTYQLSIMNTLSSSIDNIAFNGTSEIISSSVVNVISNPTITLGENSKWIVPSGKTLTITNSHLTACDKMWQGIIVEDGGTLIVNNSLIEDAKQAIHVDGTGHVEITNTIFDHNYTSIYVESSSIPKTDIIEANTFKCTGGNTLRAPFIGERTMYGIYISKVAGINIGNYLEDPLLSNKFLDINNGIVSFASIVNIYNNTFNNINDYTVPSGFTYSLTNGNAIKSTNYLDVFSKNYCKTTVITNPVINYTLNKFTNCFRAISTSRVELEAKNNTINNVQYGVLVQNTKNKVIDIEINQFSNVTYGITLSMNSASRSRIYNNQFTINDPAIFTRFPINYSNSYGISISEASPTIRSYASIMNNGISGGRNGIKLINTGEGINVFDNEILMISPLAVAGVQNGIFAQNANGTIIRGNIIEGNGMYYTEAKTPFTDPYRKRGIALDRSRNIQLGCNQASNIGYGLHFQANCETANKNITENTVSDCKYGWVLQKLYSYGYIGKEVGFNNTSEALLNNNNFMGTFNNPSNYRTFNYTDLGGLAFRPTVWHNTDPEPLYNGNNTVDIRISVLPALIDPNPFFTFNTCTSGADPWGAGLGVPEDNNGEPKDLDLINEEIYSSSNDIVAKWMEEKELYEKLRNNPDLLLSNPDYQTFYNAKQDEVLALMTEFDAKIAELSDSIILNDSLIYELKKANTQIFNEAIISTETHEINLKKIQKIYLWLQDNEIDNINQEDIGFLNEMYHACPYIAGKAVYVARAIYPLINNEDFVDDLELCNNQGVYKTSNEYSGEEQIIADISTNNIAFIKQNPADATIQIIYSIKNATKIDATILNLKGQLIQSFQLNSTENDFVFDSKKLDTGLYIIQIKCDNQYSKILKVSVVH